MSNTPPQKNYKLTMCSTKSINSFTLQYHNPTRKQQNYANLYRRLARLLKWNRNFIELNKKAIYRKIMNRLKRLEFLKISLKTCREILFSTARTASSLSSISKRKGITPNVKMLFSSLTGDARNFMSWLNADSPVSSSFLGILTLKA